MRQLVVGQFVSLDDPGVLEDLPGRQPLVRVHVEHLGDQVLERRRCRRSVRRVKVNQEMLLSCRSTLAASETESQFPPVRLKWPFPILLRISLGVSSGPLAKGVNLLGERDGRAESEGGTTVKILYWPFELVLTQPSWCRAGPPDSRCHSLRRSPGASAPEIKRNIESSLSPDIYQ